MNIVPSGTREPEFERKFGLSRASPVLLKRYFDTKQRDILPLVRPMN